VLDAKLRQKQRYAAAIRDAGLDRERLSNEERAFAHAKTAEALKLYMEDFLADVAPSLTQEQYAQLKNYETTEFTRELSRLQQRINAK
jgi:protein-disulfide isomerase-like protein with CxxC motif